MAITNFAMYPATALLTAAQTRTITKTGINLEGVLVNDGDTAITATDGTIYVNVKSTAMADDTEQEGEVPLPIGASMPILKHYTSISLKTKNNVTGKLAWFPDSDLHSWSN